MNYNFTPILTYFGDETFTRGTSAVNCISICNKKKLFYLKNGILTNKFYNIQPRNSLSNNNSAIPILESI